MNILKLMSGLLIIVFFLISILFSIDFNTNASLIVSIIASLLLFFWNKKINNNYTNITLFFIAFSVLYGLSGPIAVVWGEGLHPLFTTPNNTEAFLIGYGLANIGLVLGIIAFNLIYHKNKFENFLMEDSINKIYNNRNKLLYISLFLALFASILEIINLIRIGGFSVLFEGKATYQSLNSELTLTLPSSDIITIAYAFFGLYLGIIYSKRVQSKKLKFHVLQLLIYSSPYLIIKIILGERSILLTLFICILIGITYFKPIKKIKPKLVLIVLIFYFFLTFLFANRGLVSIIPENPQLFLEIAFKKERIIEVLNPGSNEFGAAYGNYSEFYGKYNSNFTPKLGESYIKGLLIPIPSFIFPGDKPKQITYEFRDEFFISEASRGRIAGTAFSSILEAYINFNYFGIIFIYSLFGFILQLIDKKYKYKNMYFMILYITAVPITIGFHRSALGDTFSIFFLKILILSLIFFVFIKKNQFHKSPFFRD